MPSVAPRCQTGSVCQQGSCLDPSVAFRLDREAYPSSGKTSVVQAVKYETALARMRQEQPHIVASQTSPQRRASAAAPRSEEEA